MYIRGLRGSAVASLHRLFLIKNRVKYLMCTRGTRYVLLLLAAAA